MIAYYYCSPETCLNILRNKELYLSDPLKMNDKAEIIWGIKKVMENYEHRELDCTTKKDGNLNITSEEMIKRIGERGQRNLYIISFSKNKDLLSQWRAYAKDGYGMAIGFDLEKLKINKKLSIREVDYSENIAPDEYVDNIISSNPALVAMDLPYETRLDIIIDILLSTMIDYKNPAFREEDEVRLVYNKQFSVADLLSPKDTCNEKTLDRDFRVVEDINITEYVKLPFESDAVCEISIGPKCLMNENNMKAMASHFLGITPLISCSTATYR